MKFDEWASNPRRIKQGFTKERWGSEVWAQFESLWDQAVKEDRRERSGEEFIKLVNSREWWKSKAQLAEKALRDLTNRAAQYDSERTQLETGFTDIDQVALKGDDSKENLQ